MLDFNGATCKRDVALTHQFARIQFKRIGPFIPGTKTCRGRLRNSKRAFSATHKVIASDNFWPAEQLWLDIEPANSSQLELVQTRNRGRGEQEEEKILARASASGL